MDLLLSSDPTPLIQLQDKILERAGVKLFLKRDDLIHPLVSGNKWRKLKYNLLHAMEQGYDSLLTFGGAYSNHLYAVAAAGAALGFKTIGIVRGEDHQDGETPTLRFCKDQGMTIHYVSRQEYRLRHETDYIKKVGNEFGDPYMIPEGGTNILALRGVREMVQETEEQLGSAPDYYAVAAGTGGTAAGIRSAGANVLAFSVLKGGAFLADEIEELIDNPKISGKLELYTEYHFGGYAKWKEELMQFIRSFRNKHHIQLEQVYTGKLIYGLFDLIEKNHFRRGTTIVAVHTGGLQGLHPDLSIGQLIAQ